MPTPEASVCSSKVDSGPVKGIVSTGAEVRAVWSLRKASIAEEGRVEGKGTVDLVRSVSGEAIVAKSLTNRR